MKKLLCISLSLFLILTACGSAEESKSSGLEGVDENSTTPETTFTANSDDITATEDTLATVDMNIEASGYLAYLENNSLYVYDFATETRTELAINVGTAYLYTSPDQTKLYYVTVNFEERAAFLNEYHFVDGTTQSLAVLSPPTGDRARWQLHDWSPDGQWAFFQSFQMASRDFLINVAKPDTQIELPSSSRSLFLWTTDNQLVYVTHASGVAPADIPEYQYFPAIETMSLVNLADGSVTDLAGEIDVTSITSQAELISMLTEAGYRFPDDLNTDQPLIWDPAGRNQQGNLSSYCWEYAIGQDGSILYNVVDVFHLTKLAQLNDTSLLFLEISFADCSFLNGPTGKLMLVTPDSTPLTLSDKIMSVQDRNYPGSLLLGTRFSLAPSEDYVAVIETDADATANMLNIINLETCEMMPLLIDGEPIESVTSVIWGQ